MQTAPRLCEMKCDLCGEIVYTSSRQQTTAFVKAKCAGKLLSVLPGMCGAAAGNIWMTLMKGEE